MKKKKRNSKPHNSLSKIGKDVSLRRRIEVLEEDVYKLKKGMPPLEEEIDKIKDRVGISN